MTALVLKLIAVLTMLCDHTAVALNVGGYLPYDTLYQVMRGIGRVAFPIFGFLLANGARHTRNKAVYALRMLIFAAVSELPFDLVSYGDAARWNLLAHQNVFFTLLAGLLVIYAMQWACGRQGTMRIVGGALAFGAYLCAAVFCLLARTDYDFAGVTMIAAFGLLALPEPRLEEGSASERLWRTGVSAIAVLLLGLLTNPLEYYAFFALIPIAFYNGRRGYSSRALQYGFYLFYPAHLLILALLFTVPVLR